MIKALSKFLSFIAVSFALLLAAGCDNDGDLFNISGSAASNGSKVVVCVGDSITAGYLCNGPTYPQRLAEITGRQVRNAGVNGLLTESAMYHIQAALSVNPGHICILLRANDAIRNRDVAQTAENIRAMILLCKNNNVVPIVGMPPAQHAEHSIYSGRAKDIGEAIKKVCKDENVKCIDLYSLFEKRPDLYVTDGLHLNADGALIVAQKFAAAIR